MAGLRMKGKLEGVAEAAAALDGLKKSIRNKVLRRALTAAGRILARAVKDKVIRKRSGQTKKAVGSAVRTYPKAVVAVVGVRRGFALEGSPLYSGRRHDPAYIAHLINAGVLPHALGAGSSLRDVWRREKISAAVRNKRGKLVKKAVFSDKLILRQMANQRGKKHPGFQGIRFMERGFAAGKVEAEAKAVALIAEGVEEEARKLGKAS